jgi:hypothetical protein
VILAESHLSIHTWPEYGYAAVDVYTCGARLQPGKAVEYLARALGARRRAVLQINRGRFAQNGNGEVTFRPDVLRCSDMTKREDNGHEAPQDGAPAGGSSGSTEPSLDAWTSDHAGAGPPHLRVPGVPGLKPTGTTTG